MTSAPSPNRARWGVRLMFFTNGVLFSALLPRYPELKRAFDLDNAQFGVVVVAFPLGALAAAALAGPAMRRVGVLRLNGAGSVALAAAMAVAGLSQQVWLFVAALLVAGAFDALVDAAQNVQGVLVERWSGRSLINSFHATWSIGAATGGVIGAGAAALDVSPGVQMAVNGAVWAVVAVLACRLATVTAEVSTVEEATDQPSRGPGSGRAWLLLLPLVLLAICGTLVEDVANNWAALFLGDVVEAPAGIAGLGVTVMLGAQFVGRVVGDPMTDRWGRESVARAGGIAIATGALVVVAAPGYVIAFVGLALMGAGCATLVPAAFAAAGRIPGFREGSGIALLGWLMRLGFLLTSPSIGLLSQATDLRTAMLIPVGAGVVAAGIAHRQRQR